MIIVFTTELYIFISLDNSGPSGFHSTPSSKYNTYNSYASVEERPTVDSLLNEMDNASLYAVPNG